MIKKTRTRFGTAELGTLEPTNPEHNMSGNGVFISVFIGTVLEGFFYGKMFVLKL